MLRLRCKIIVRLSIKIVKRYYISRVLKAATTVVIVIGINYHRLNTEKLMLMIDDDSDIKTGYLYITLLTDRTKTVSKGNICLPTQSR